MIKCTPLLRDELHDIVFKWLMVEGFYVTFDQEYANVYATHDGTSKLSFMLSFHPFADPPTMDVKASDGLRSYTERIYLCEIRHSLGIMGNEMLKLHDAIDDIKILFGS